MAGHLINNTNINTSIPYLILSYLHTVFLMLLPTFNIKVHVAVVSQVNSYTTDNIY